jgi:predicted SAM-dependent methyltransferase
MKLHIGGKQIKDDWKILNIQKNAGVDFIGDISDLSQFATDSIDEIYASHVLEHISHTKIMETLQGIFRVLKKDGKFYVSVPDMDVLCHTFINPLASPDQKLHIMAMIFGGQIDEFDFHYFGWNEQFLTNFLWQVGFSKWERVSSFNLFNDTSDYKPYGFPISLNMIATK